MDHNSGMGNAVPKLRIPSCMHTSDMHGGLCYDDEHIELQHKIINLKLT